MALVHDAIPAVETLLRAQLSDRDQIQAYYVLANLWGHRHRLKTHLKAQESWAWDCDEWNNEIACLRKAVAHSGFRDQDPFVRCSILTNLGNCLDHVGRPADAIQYWERALAIDLNFPMARENLGIGLYHYGTYLYDQGHTAVFFRFVLQHLEQALSNELNHDAREGFQAIKDTIDKFFSDANALPLSKLNAFPTGRSNAKKAYRH